MKTVNETAFSTMNNLIDEQTKKAWALHKKLGETSYDFSGEQFEDMVKLGKIAESVINLRKAFHTVCEE